MKRKNIIAIVLLTPIGVCCLFGFYYLSRLFWSPDTTPQYGESTESGCPIPKDFSEQDLGGTWVEMFPQMNSTIIIRDDNFYKQIMIVESADFKYESDWQPWNITYSESKLPYLHLEGLLSCSYWSEKDCRSPDIVGGDILNDAELWFDYCQEKWVKTPGERVFMVFGVDESYDQPPRGIILTPLTKSPDGITGPSYFLEGPWEP